MIAARLLCGSALALLVPALARAEDSLGFEPVLPKGLTFLGIVRDADPIVQGVMALLAAASLLTWTILVAKGLELASLRRQAARAAVLFARSTSLDAATSSTPGSGLAATLLDAAEREAQVSHHLAAEGVKERVASALARVEAGAARRAMRGLGIVATIGPTAPFVGLFGTVWGIMNSFLGIAAAETTNLAVVAPGIAEALLATAVGLVAAIPAVVVYNLFARATAAYRGLVADASSALLRLVSRDLDRAAFEKG